ncbi:MAG: hypothetical protein N3Z28_00735 [Synechococcaceae cyanobacterium MAG-AL2]|uniref:hypothetical protein n=1 Tax=Candidatus Regnicoccus frigidus TaxID=3074015 RepID=UPI00281C74A3|nr:hypothetical protein [Candidatus Regnicoccus frigidus]MCT4366179.1 hypothetical protein [Candidatus Regnicoccus frigidus MAG-AL2]
MIHSLPAWLHNHPVMPDGRGYVSTAGEPIHQTAREILATIHPHHRLHAERNLIVLRACVAYATSRFDADRSAGGLWQPTAAPFSDHLEVIEPLLAHGFWDQLTCHAAPIHLRHRRLMVATTAELLVKFRNGGDLGIATVQTAPRDQLNPIHVEAELGAALALLGDSWGWFPSRSFVIYARPGKTTVELVGVDQAIGHWVDALDSRRWLIKNLQRTE